MTNFYIISDIDSDSDCDSDNSDYEQDEDMQMTSDAEKPKQAQCLKPLPLFKIEKMDPIIINNTYVQQTSLLTRVDKTPAPAQPKATIKSFKNPFKNVVFIKESPI
jgi:hypothetical protein